jgi:hypothetical protein
MKQLAQSSWLKPRVKVLASEDDGCALGVITELRMKPARLVASFAPMLGSDDEYIAEYFMGFLELRAAASEHR